MEGSTSGVRITRRDVVRAASTGAAVAVTGGGLGAVAGGGLAASPAVAATPTGPLARHHAAAVLHGWVDALYGSQRAARALPPSAARLYGIAMLAGYEAVVDGMPSRRSLGGRLNDLLPSPVTGAKHVHWGIAANIAIGDVAVAQSFDRQPDVVAALQAHGRSTHDALAAGHPAGVVADAVRHGQRVARWLNDWAGTDGYAATRGLAYTPPVGPGLWERTPPNRGAAIEPYWAQVRPMALRVQRHDGGQVVDPAAPPPPIPYSADPGSAMYDQAQQVLQAWAGLTDAQRETAMYWRDNPDGVSGLPAGHWLQIGSEVCIDLGQDLGEASRTLALLAIGTADAFTSCWIEKYRSNVLRPVTYIRANVPGYAEWLPYVNSPAFPEYTSGHSVSSAAAARVLTVLVGDRPFTDRRAEGKVVEDNDLRRWTLSARTFAGFQAAAQEAAVSRLYGGIHFPMAIEHGLTQGTRVADLVLQVADTRPGNR